MDARSRSSQRAALIALGVTGVLAVAKIVVWIATGSLAVLSQAIDSLLDIVALGLVLVAVRVASKPADASHHYGHAKAENLVAFAQTVFLSVIVIGIVVEAVRRMGEEAPVEAPVYALVVLALSALVDAGRAMWLVARARSSRSAALAAGALNVATDVGTALVALVSLLFVRAGSNTADAVGGFLVAIAVGVAAYRLGKRSVDVLMDRAPTAPVEAIEEAAARATGVAETRRVRVRGTTEQVFADVTVAAGRTASLERAHQIAEEVEREIDRVVPGADVVVHVEPISETTGLVERVHAAASRIDRVRQIHNVVVHAFNDAGRSKLHVTLHAKVDGTASIEQAHSVADEVEEMIVRELGDHVRVDAHIEPLERTVTGRDVTDSREDVVGSVRELTRAEADIADCHEILVTSANDSLSIVAHVRARRDLPLARIHEASERIEKGLHSLHPEIGEVLIHFEPA